MGPMVSRRACWTLRSVQCLPRSLGRKPRVGSYPYASCDRRAVYPKFASSGAVQFHNRLSGEVAVVAEEDAKVFVELTAANELDIIMVNPGVAEAFGAGLLKLLRGAQGRLGARLPGGSLPRHSQVARIIARHRL